MGVGFQVNFNGLDHVIDFSQHLIIPKSQRPEPSLLKSSRTVRIMHSLILMLSAIDFHDQFCREANKIENVILKRVLPSKLKSKLISTQPIP